MPPDDSGTARFGEVWTVQVGDQESPRLIVSGPRYASARPTMVLTAVVHAPPLHPSYAAPSSGFLGEDLPDGIGRAQLDLITVVYRHRLIKRVGALAGDRHESVTSRVRDLIGP